MHECALKINNVSATIPSAIVALVSCLSTKPDRLIGVGRVPICHSALILAQVSDFVNLVDNIDFATYKTSEQAVGTWIDGKTIYRKVIDTGMVSRSTLNPYNTGITISHLINAEGYWLNGSNSQQMAFGNTLAIDGGIIQTTRAFASNEGALNIQFIQVGGTAPSQVQIVVALYYTKTS